MIRRLLPPAYASAFRILGDPAGPRTIQTRTGRCVDHEIRHKRAPSAPSTASATMFSVPCLKDAIYTIRPEMQSFTWKDPFAVDNPTSAGHDEVVEKSEEDQLPIELFPSGLGFRDEDGNLPTITDRRVSVLAAPFLMFQLSPSPVMNEGLIMYSNAMNRHRDSEHRAPVNTLCHQ